MANSVHRDRHGPDWPLGSIVVAAAGTPVSIMSLVDAANANDPSTATTSASDEYTVAFGTIIVQGFKSSAPMVANVGNLYLIRKGVGGGSGNRADQGVIVLIIPPGGTGTLGAAALVRNVFNPYRYFLDADNSGDAGQVTGLVF